MGYSAPFISSFFHIYIVIIIIIRNCVPQNFLKLHNSTATSYRKSWPTIVGITSPRPNVPYHSTIIVRDDVKRDLVERFDAVTLLHTLCTGLLQNLAF